MVTSPVSVREVEEIMPRVSEVIRSASDKAKNRIIRPETLLLEELALDSLDMVRVVMLIEDQHGVVIDLDEISNMKSAGDLARVLLRETKAAA